MAIPSVESFLDLVRKSGIVDDKRFTAFVDRLRDGNGLPADPGKLAGIMVRDAILTKFQAEQLLAGRWRGFQIGKYRVLERLGAGGMGSVYLCEHKVMRRRVAIKVLPTAKAEDPSALERFYREARAVAALDHPNIVRAYDIDQDEKLHFLVMEYVDGSSLQDIIKKCGPMDATRAAHYIRQAALGLQHAHEAGLVHRDIKPGNVLVDRNGIVKVLDMGLARFFHDEEDNLTKKYDENVLGTADYLAPEQALDSHSVDIRADIYGLGLTFYFTLTGRPPFTEGTVTQKLIWHQTRQPKPIKELRADAPDDLVAVVQKMTAKEAAQRYQTPKEVAQALEPLTATPIAPPPEVEMPKLSPAALGEDTKPPPDTKAPPTVSPTADTALRKPVGPASPTPPPPAAPRTSTPASRSAPAKTAASISATADTARSLGSAVAKAPPAPVVKASPARPAASPSVTQAPRSDAPVISPARSDDKFPWAATLDTSDPASGGTDTVRSVLRKKKPASGLSLKRLNVDVLRKLDRRQWIIIGAAGGGVLLLVILFVLGLYFLVFGDKPKSQGPVIGGPGEVQAGPDTWFVSKKEDKDFKTLTEALQRAKPGDRIVVRDQEFYDAPLVLAGNALGKKDITIEALQGAVLRASSQHSPREPLLSIDRVDGLKLKGFVLDGENKMEELIRISGSCPGLTLENLRLRNFKRTGIHVSGCNNRRGREARLQGLQIDLPAATARDKHTPGPAALGFYSVPGQFMVSQFVIVQDCRFEGPYEAAVHFRSNVAHTFFERNIFHGTAGSVKDASRDAVLYSSADPKESFTLQGIHFLNNTFFNYQRVLAFLQVPDLQKSNIEFTNNLFYQIAVGVGEVGQLGLSADRLAIVTKTGTGNIYDQKTSKPGPLKLNLKPLDFTLPTGSSDAPDFLRYAKNSPLATAGKDGQPVGAREPLP